MVANLYLVACAILLLVLQSALGRFVQVGAAAPDLYVLFVVYLVSVLSPSRALVAAWTLGLVRDCFTPAPLGVDACALVAAAGLVVWAHRRFVLDTDVALVFLTFVAGLAHGLVWAGVLTVTTAGAEFLPLLLRIGLPAAVYSAIVMPLFVRVVTRGWRRALGGPKPRLA